MGLWQLISKCTPPPRILYCIAFLSFYSKTNLNFFLIFLFSHFSQASHMKMQKNKELIGKTTFRKKNILFLMQKALHDCFLSHFYESDVESFNHC